MAVQVTDSQDRVPLSAETVELLERVTSTALGNEAASLVDVTLVDDRTIRDLNRLWRGIDRPTDVLSFSQREGEPLAGEEGDGSEVELLGDVIVSVETAARQAAEFGHSLERELCFLTVHGVLHLLGWSHDRPEDEAQMMQRTEEILAGFGLGRA